MPTAATTKAAKRRRGSASTKAGEFVHEEIEHIREGKHGARNAKQAIAIGLSKARRAGIKVKPGPSASSQTKRKAAQESRRAGKKPSTRRSRATSAALEREGTRAASHTSLSRHAKAAAPARKKSRKTRRRAS